MSLLLRQSNQEILDQFGFTSFHTRVNDNKNLSICTACGEPFITISGIQFSKAAPAKVEVEYSNKLLQDFLTKNNKEINAYVDAYIAFTSKDVIPADNKELRISINTHSNYNFGYLYFSDDYITYSFTLAPATGIRSSEIEKMIIDSPADFVKAVGTYVYPKHLEKAAIKYFVAYNKYVAESVALDNLKTELNKCDV